MNTIVFKIKMLKLAVTVLLIWLSFFQTAHANLVQNPFFTGTGAVANDTSGVPAGNQAATNWTSYYCCNGFGSVFGHLMTVKDPSSPVVRPAVPAPITAAGGTTEFYTGCNTTVNGCITFPAVLGQSSGAQQAIPTVIGTSYTLSFWTFSSGLGTLANKSEVDAYWGNTSVFSGINITPSGWSQVFVNLGAATTNATNITVLLHDNPDLNGITYLDVEPIVLRLAKSNPPSLAVGVPANYSLTTTNISTTTSGTSFTIQDKLPPNIAFNSAAAGLGITSVTGCTTAGALATGLIVTCTANVTGGIAPGGTGTLTLNVTPQVASAGVAGINRASVQVNGGVPNITGTTTPLPDPANAATCTDTDTPSLGCAVAASITPAAAQLTFTKTATLICDPFNGTSNQKNIPGAIVRWTMTVANTGATSVNLTTVSDLLSVNTTFDPNLITGAGGAAGCNSATGTPESAAGKGFKLSIVGGTRPAAAYPKFFTTAADADAATLSGATVTINYALGLPLEAGYTAGQLNSGESVVVYFNVTIN